jgi:hypothetical protein
MKVIKLDRRYMGFPKWKYAIQFPLNNHNGYQEYFAYQRAFYDMYGPDAYINPEYNGPLSDAPGWLRSEHWYAQFGRQRILFNDQAVISMIRLKITD